MDTILFGNMEKKPDIKRIAIVLNSAWQAYNFRLNLATYLSTIGYEVIFISPEDNHYSELIKDQFKFVSINLKADSVNPIDDLRLVFSLYKIFNKIKPDIVLNFTIKPNIYSSIVSRLIGIPSINNITGLGTVFIKQSLITKLIKNLYRFSLACSSKVFFQNYDDLNLFLNEKIVSSSKCEILPGSGVDTNKFFPTKSNYDKTFKFLMIARIIRDKGVYEYIEAARMLNNENLEFWLLGQSDTLNKTSLSIDEIIKFTNKGLIKYFKKTDDVKSFLDQVDCVVLPSYREGCPRSILEASASGLPVIVSDVPGCRQVVDDNITGLYCKVRDKDDLKDKMIKMIQMTNNERKLMGQKGRAKMINDFDELIVIKRYSKLISDLL